MAQTLIIVDVNDITGEIWRIIHPEDDSQIPMHPPENGHTRHHLRHSEFPVNEETHRPMYGLHEIGDAIEKNTGRRPTNARRP